ncbi:MAG: TerC family protein [Candidatus Sumerlaeaceae bacterium]|nr:TerC family protein [Candidatus Sumerlaeaceae bacterium]
MEWLASPEVWIGFITLTVLELVLGIDNIVFISILAGRLPREQQARARRLGLTVAMVSRILLLCFLGLIMRLNKPLFTVLGHGISGRDLILCVGGLFLIAKATMEIHHKLEGAAGGHGEVVASSLASVLAQIFMIDVVFSLDSVITAVGMVEHVPVMIAAVVTSVALMMFFINPISHFVDRHPTVRMLALAFLVLIGVNLVAESFHHAIPKGYTYFAMAFSVCVEMLNIRLRGQAEPVRLRSGM